VSGVGNPRAFGHLDLLARHAAQMFAVACDFVGVAPGRISSGEVHRAERERLGRWHLRDESGEGEDGGFEHAISRIARGYNCAMTSAGRLFFAILLATATLAQPLKFDGRTVTVIEPSKQDDFFPTGPASVCLEGPPQIQCFTMPEEYGNNPHAEVVALDKGKSALLFSAASGGVSGWSIKYAMLRPVDRNELEDFLRAGTVSNQSEHAVWNAPAISSAPIFVTATYRSGPGETHYGPHRYMISAYVLLSDKLLDGDFYYFLDDEYLTVNKYDLETQHVLATEKATILARLRRAKASRAPKPKKAGVH
jgi:hypothetical protein